MSIEYSVAASRIAELVDEVGTLRAECSRWHAEASALAASHQRLKEALQSCVGVMKLQRDLIERGQHAAAWNPAIELCEAALKDAT